MEHVKDVLLRVVPHGGGRMWTDEELDAAEQREYYASGGTVTGMAELYRLARLGLAAEQVGREGFDEGPSFSRRALNAFLNHEAWKK